MSNDNFISEINSVFDDSQNLIKNTSKISEKINDAINEILHCLNNNGKIVLFGNGGSAADAQHMTAELIGRFKMERKSIPAISMTTDTSIITSIGNDYDFNKIFARQCESLVNKNDIIIAISTSGNSENIINGILKSKEKGAFVIGLTGNSGGKLNSIADISLNVPSNDTARIQEGHRVIIHCLCQIIEQNISN